ncbi:bacterio-opsin activator [Halobacteriales archaeon QS_1_68_20]|nr:MAG: bacterio-opsin activator [Halobacteriales archaeon QS_1_68_20]
MSLVAEAQVAHPDIALTPTVRAVPGATVERERLVVRDLDPSFLFVSVSCSSFERFEDTLATDGTVTESLVISDDARRVYRVTLSEERKRLAPIPATLGINLERAYSQDDSWVLRLQLPDREVLSAFNDYCDEAGIQVAVTSLRRTSAAEDRIYGLTEPQRDLLAVAHEEGYFDDPRGISLQDLAEQFDVSPTALSRRLRRAQDNLIRAALGT